MSGSRLNLTLVFEWLLSVANQEYEYIKVLCSSWMRWRWRTRMLSMWRHGTSAERWRQFLAACCMWAQPAWWAYTKHTNSKRETQRDRTTTSEYQSFQTRWTDRANRPGLEIDPGWVCLRRTQVQPESKVKCFEKGISKMILLPKAQVSKASQSLCGSRDILFILGQG
jgi:hypothetical protein